jgi:uncharacterized protein YdaU (DUF1376 family)
MANNRKWMPLYIADYLADTAHLDSTGNGAYLFLIMHYWQHGRLPTDPKALRRIARLNPRQASKWMPILARFFGPDWRHKRIDHELQRADEVTEKRARAGVIGNAIRWNPHRKWDRNATYTDIDRSSTVERVRARTRSKKEANRDKEGNGIEPSPELVELERSKGHKP